MSADTQKPEAKSIVPRERLAFVPKDFDDAWRQADVLSKSNILPDALRGKPHDILATIVTGAELGLSPMQSMRDIFIVKGKGFVSSALKVALVKQSDACEFFQLVESTPTRAIYETKRKGEPKPTRLEYTMEQAKTAGLASNDNYTKHPDAMLRSRCSGRLCDIVYPDVIRGVGDKDDLPAERAIAVNAAPQTFAPPAPPIEDAQVVAPTPPPPTPKQAFEQAKNDLELKGVAPAEPPKRERIKIDDKTTETVEQVMSQQIDAHQQRLDRQPGDDDGDETPTQIPVSNMKPGAEAEARQLLSEVNGVDPNLPGATEQLDLIAPRAKQAQGPLRQQIADAVKAKREAIKKARGGK